MPIAAIIRSPRRLLTLAAAGAAVVVTGCGGTSSTPTVVTKLSEATPKALPYTPIRTAVQDGFKKTIGETADSHIIWTGDRILVQGKPLPDDSINRAVGFEDARRTARSKQGVDTRGQSTFDGIVSSFRTQKTDGSQEAANLAQSREVLRNSSAEFKRRATQDGLDLTAAEASETQALKDGVVQIFPTATPAQVDSRTAAAQDRFQAIVSGLGLRSDRAVG